MITVVECDALPAVQYTEITNAIPSVYVYTNLTIYDCVLGYELTGGNFTRQCTETSEWSGVQPNCTSK